MGKKPVDFGPMALPVGDDGINYPHLIAARQKDVTRMNELLTDVGQRKDGKRTYEADETENTNILNATESSGEAEALILLAETLPSMTPAIGTAASSSVQLQLNSNLLVDSRLVAYEINGRLHFEILVNDLASHDWLVNKLPWLVRQVGERLGRSLSVKVIDLANPQRLSITETWSEGTPA